MRLRVSPSIPGVPDPRFRFTRSQAVRSVAGSQTRLKRSPKRFSASSPAQRCSLVCHPCTRAAASSAADGAGVFTPDLLEGFAGCVPAALLPHVTGFPGLRVVRRLRHAPHTSADSAPARPPPAAGRARGASLVHRDPFERVGSRLYPCSASAEQSQSLRGHRAPCWVRGAGRHT